MRFWFKMPLVSPTLIMFTAKSPKTLLNLAKLVERYWPFDTSSMTTSNILALARFLPWRRSTCKLSKSGTPAPVRKDRRLMKNIFSFVEKRTYGTFLPEARFGRMVANLLFMYDAHYLLQGRLAGVGLLETGFHHRGHAVLHCYGLDVVRGGLLQDGLADLVVHHQHLVNTDAAVIAAVVAGLATLAVEELTVQFLGVLWQDLGQALDLNSTH